MSSPGDNITLHYYFIILRLRKENTQHLSVFHSRLSFYIVVSNTCIELNQVKASEEIGVAAGNSNFRESAMMYPSSIFSTENQDILFIADKKI